MGQVSVSDDLRTLLDASGLSELGDKLTAAGYLKMDGLGESETEVKDAITAAVGEDWKKPGEIRRLVQLWITWKQGQDSRSKNVPAPVDCALSRALLAAHLSDLAGWLTTNGGYSELAELGDTEDAVRTAVKKVAGEACRAADVEQVVGLWRAAKRQAGVLGAQDKAVPCPLTTALVKNGLVELAVRLTKASYRELKDLGDKEETVRQRIVSVVGDKYPKPGEIEQVVGLWKAVQKSTGTILDLPSLKAADPDGKGIDLSSPTLKIDDVVYKFPDSIAATKSDDKTIFKSAGDLSLLEWTVIAKRTGLLHALDMDMAAAAVDADSPVLADRPAFVWKPKDDSDIFKPVQVNGFVATDLAYTASAGNLVHSKITKGSLDLQSPFCSASVEMSRAERNAEHSEHKVLHVSGRYQYIYAILKLGECLAPNAAFVSAVDAARKEPTLAAQGDALEALFRKFGHLVPDTVTLGGELYFTSTRETSGAVSETTVKDNITAAVTAKYEGFGGGAGVASATGDKTTTEVQQITEHARSCCSGGDGYLAGNPKDWPASTRDPNKWAVIRRDGLRLLTSFLDPDRKSWIEGVWNQRLKTYWGGIDPPWGYIKPDLYSIPFVLRSNMDSVKGLGLRASLDPRNQPVGLVESNVLGQPIGDRLAWQLRYSGANSPSGAPVYFIVESLTDAQKTARAIAWENKKKKLKETGYLVDTNAIEPVHCARLAARNVDGVWQVICEQVPDAGTDQPVKTNLAAWILTPVDPQRKPSPSEGVDYVISSFAQPRLGFGAPAGIGPRFVPLVEPSAQRPWYCHVPR